MKHLAEKYHNGQFRKSKDETSVKVPYISHPQAVAETLIRWGESADSDAVAAAWGHDLLEDTAVSECEIIAVSNERVLACIKALTHDGSCDKELWLKKIADSQMRDTILVKTADRICNSADFVQLKDELYAFQYLHQADPLVSALESFADDEVAQNALAAWKELDSRLEKSARRLIIRGSILGGAVGDALGSPIEFMSISDIKSAFGGMVDDYVEFGDGTGAITDDTQMTLFTCEGILRGMVRSCEKGICGARSVMHYAYLRWLKTQVICVKAWNEALNSGWLIKEKQLFARRAPGMTCISALRDTSIGKRAANKSKGCGTVMRMAPAGLYFFPESAYELGCEFSEITHGHPTGITAGGAFAMLISYLCRGKTLNTALDLLEEHLNKIPEAVETLEAVRHARRADSVCELGQGWVAEEALAIGIYCALHHTWDFKAGVLAAVNISGDSDSVGAIAGNILGALNGENGIPEKWRKNLREYDLVSCIADDLYQKIETDESGHVTEKWWNKYPGF